LRVAAEIKRSLPDLIRRHVRMPNELFVSVLDVEVNADLSLARVFVSVVGGHERWSGKKIERLLNEHRGPMRKELAGKLVMRQHPDLRFVFDETEARAQRIEDLLKQVKAERPGEDSET